MITIFTISNIFNNKRYTTFTENDDIYAHISTLKQNLLPYTENPKLITEDFVKYHPYYSILSSNAFITEIHEIFHSTNVANIEFRLNYWRQQQLGLVGSE